MYCVEKECFGSKQDQLGEIKPTVLTIVELCLAELSVSRK